MKSRTVAAILAFFGGVIGLHKFYLRDTGAGIFYFVLFFITSRFFMPVSAILGILDGIRLLNMTDESFDLKYNQGNTSIPRRQRQQDRYRQREKAPSRQEPIIRSNRSNPFKKSGIQKYKEFDLEEAIVDFNKGLEIEPQDIALHFNLACAYSLTENKEKAYYHLAKAKQYGFKDDDRILTHDDLAYIRIQPEFEEFKNSGFLILPQGKNTAPKIIEEIKDEALLSQLNKLAELRKKGLLSEDEFLVEKEKLLSH